MSRKRELAREQSLTDLEQALGEREQLVGDREQSRIDREQLVQDDLRESGAVGDKRQDRILADSQARIDREQASRDVSQEARDHAQEGRHLFEHEKTETQRKILNRAVIRLEKLDERWRWRKATHD